MTSLSTGPFANAVQEEFGSSSDLGITVARLGQEPPGGGAGAGGATAAGVTQLTLPFTQPGVGASVVASVGSSQGFSVGQIVFVPGLGFLVVTVVAPGSVTLFNGGAPGNAAMGATAPVGTLVSLAGSPVAGRIGRQLWVAAGAPINGDGGIDAPFATIQAAMDFITAQGTPDWSVKIEPGTYPEAVTIPALDRIQIVGSGPGITIIAPPGGGPGVKQIAPVAPVISSLEIRDLEIRIPDASVAIFLNGAAPATYFSGDGVNLLNLILQGPTTGAGLFLVRVMGGRVEHTLAGDVSIVEAGALSFSDCSLGAVGLTGSSLSSHAFVNPVSFLAGTNMLSLNAQSDVTGPPKVYIDATSFIFTSLIFGDAPVSAAASGAYLEMRGECNSVSITSAAVAPGTPGVYDLRGMKMSIMGGALGAFTATISDGVPLDARGSDLSGASFALTAPGGTPFVVDLRKAFYSETSLRLGAGPNVLADRDLVSITPVAIGASPAVATVVIAPPFPVTAYSVPQPEMDAGPGSLLLIGAKTGGSFTATSTGPGGTYSFLVLRRP